MDYRSALIAQGVDAVTVDKFMAWHRNNPKVTRFKDKSNITTWGGKIYKVETEGYMVIE